MQSGNAQVRETPADILKLISAGFVKLTAPNDMPIYFNPSSCTEIGEFVEFQGDKKNAGAKTKMKTEIKRTPVPKQRSRRRMRTLPSKKE
jgi:hypothetical protein